MKNIFFKKLLFLENKFKMKYFFLFLTIFTIIEHFPLSSNKLIQEIRNLHFLSSPFQMSQVYAILHGRQTETCSTFKEQHNLTFEKVELDYNNFKSQNSEQSSFFYLIKRYDEELKELFLGKSDQNCWKESAYWGYFQSYFGRDVPFVLLYDKFGLSSVHYIIFNHLMIWIGLLSIFQLAKLIIKSNTLSFILFLITLGNFINFQQHLLFYLLQSSLMFLSIYIFHYLLRLDSKVSYFGLAGIFFLYFIQLYHDLTIYPIPHTMNSTILLMAFFLISILSSKRKLIFRFIFLLILFLMFKLPYLNYSKQFFNLTTNYNQASSEGFASISPIVGLFERQNPLGLPPDDYVFPKIFDYDIFLKYKNSYFIVNQSSKFIGFSFLKEAQKLDKFIFVKTTLTRMIFQTFLPHKINFEYIDPNFNTKTEIFLFYISIFLFLTILFFSLMSLKFFKLTIPFIVFIGWHYYGINTLFYYQHNHNYYYVSGKILLFFSSFIFIFFFIRYFKVLKRRLKKIYYSKKSRIVFGIIILTLLASSFSINKLIKKELLSIELWSDMHRNMFKENLKYKLKTPDQVVLLFNKFKEEGVYEAGQTEMFFAWILHGFVHHSGIYKIIPIKSTSNEEENTIREGLRKRAEELSLKFFDEAIKVAPENPFYPSCANYFNHPEWKKIFEKAIYQFPNNPYVSYMSWNLLQTAATESERDFIALVYEESVKNFLHKSSNDRKGFQENPSLKFDSFKENSLEGINFKLKQNPDLKTDFIFTDKSPKFEISFYLKTIIGKNTVIVKDSKNNIIDSCSQVTTKPKNHLNYMSIFCINMEKFDKVYLSINSIEDSNFIFRDLYPLITVIRKNEWVR